MTADGERREIAGAGAVVEEVDPGIGADDEWTWIQLWGVFMSGYFGHLVDEWADRMDPDVLALVREISEQKEAAARAS